MGKYYIQTGQIKVVLSAPWIENAEEAACEALLQYACTLTPAPLIIVSERGFECNLHEHNEDSFFATVDLLKKTGLLDD